MACSCNLDKLDQFYQGASLVIKGKLIKVDTIEILQRNETYRGIKFWKKKYSFSSRKLVRAAIAVQTVYKISQFVQDTIYVITPSVEDCGYHFVPNEYLAFADEEYIVFASSIASKNIELIKEKNSDKYYYTSNCYGTRKANAQDASELQKISTK